jgi:hypothetical protein
MQRYLAKAEAAWLLAALVGVAVWNRGRALARIGKPHFGVQAARGLGVDGQRCLVGGGDRVDDGQPEAVFVTVTGALGAKPLEGLLKAIQLLGRDYQTVVGHRQDRLPLSSRGRDINATASHVVIDRVV